MPRVRRHSLLLPLLLALSVGSLCTVRQVHASDCAVPRVDYEALKDPNRQEGGKPAFLVFDKVCVDQETIVIYDPQTLADNLKEDDLVKKFPDVEGMQFLFRHAGASEAATAVAAANHDPNNAQQSGVSGRQHPYGSDLATKLHVRMASEDELKDIPSEFSKCTVPIVVFQKWPHNLGEFFARALSSVWQLQQAEARWGNDTTLVMAYPEKLRLAPHNAPLLQPFTRYQPITFADLSSRLPSDAPSNSTAEGRHVRCFDKLLVWRILDEHFSGMGHAAQFIMQHFQPSLPQVSVWGDGGLDDDVLRVFIETRPHQSYRNFLQLPELLAACAADGAFSMANSRFKRVRCYSRVLGEHFLDDLALMATVSVFVSMHGAGQANALFMKPGSAVLEVRPLHFGTWYKAWANHYQPTISQQTGRAFLWYGLNMDDETLSKASDFEVEQQDRGGDSFNARDRHVLLQWPVLRHMLDIIAGVAGDVTAYEALWPHAVAYTVRSGNNITADGDIWKQASEGPWSGR